MDYKSIRLFNDFLLKGVSAFLKHKAGMYLYTFLNERQ
jgi:hypothetical protein